MTNNKTFTANSNRSWGDVALDGLWPGLVGGIVMMIYFILTGLLDGNQPLDIFGYFVPTASSSSMAGLGAHLAVSAVHGTLFGLITAVVGRWLSNRGRFLAVGLLYGLLLWTVAWLVIIPSGLSGLDSIPAGHLFIGHLIFGAVLGWRVANSRSS